MNGCSQELTILERIEKIYLHLEYIAKIEAKNFSDSGKANLRRAQADLQRVRLAIIDLSDPVTKSPETIDTSPNAKTRYLWRLVWPDYIGTSLSDADML